jgi:hypothetical protein
MSITVFAWDSPSTYLEVTDDAGKVETAFHNVVSDLGQSKEILKRILGAVVFDRTGKAVGDINFRGHIYKIGMTDKPIQRAHDHEDPLVDPKTRAHDPELWNAMHVIHQCIVQNDVRNAERQLMAYAKEQFGGWKREEYQPGYEVFSLNFRAGGAGRPSKADTFYAYLLLSRG